MFERLKTFKRRKGVRQRLSGVFGGVVALIKLSVSAATGSIYAGSLLPHHCGGHHFCCWQSATQTRQEKIHGQQLNPKRDLRFKRQPPNFCVVNAVARSIKRVLRGGSISLPIFLALKPARFIISLLSNITNEHASSPVATAD
jgi:hypothetical protein